MKNYIQKYICKSVALFVGTSLMLTGCSESFLDPDPQTMFEPETVFSTENGIKSVLAICDRQLKRNYVSEDFQRDDSTAHRIYFFRFDGTVCD